MRKVVLSIILFGVQAPVSAQTTLKAPCAACAVVRTPIVRLTASLDQPSPTLGSRMARDARGRYYVAPMSEPGTVGVYDERGRFVQLIGRKGRGPGEFENPVLVNTSLNSLYVLDDETNRISVFDSSYRFVNLISAVGRIADFAVTPSGVVVHTTSRGRVPGPLVQVIESKGTTKVLEAGKSLDPVESGRVIASLGNSLWIADRYRYRLRQFAPSGALQSNHRRVATWFPDPGAASNRRVGDGIVSIYDLLPTNNVLWVLITRRNRRTTVLPSKINRLPNGEAAGASFSILQAKDATDFWIEVIDLSTIAVVGSAKFDLIGGFLPPDLAYEYQENTMGLIEIQIYRLTVRKH